MSARIPTVGATVLMVLAGSWADAQAQPLPNPELVCQAEEPRASIEGYLRSLSLDLTGRLPLPEDYDAIGDDASDAIDAMLASQAFVERSVRRHRALFLNSIANVGLYDFRTSLGRTREGLYWRSSTFVATMYRGERVPCLDEPATFDADGRPEWREIDGLRREGYVEVEPYWAPGSTIKVCAFDAQAQLRSPRGETCGSRAGLSDPGCGCGPALNWCRYGSNRIVNESFSEDLDRRVAAVIREGEPYTELFKSRRAFVNGPILHYYRHQVSLSAGVSLAPVPFDLSRMPDLPFSASDTWIEVELPASHAGVLTSPAFLLRFQTNRARANRFFDTFLCQPFVAPPDGLASGDGAEIPNPDLQQREGCKYCHALLEPAAAHWGRWAEQGAGYLSSEEFPSFRDDCAICGTTGQLCSRECRLFYVTRPLTPQEREYVGALRVFQFLKDDHLKNVDLGPAFLVDRSIVDDRLPRCVARRAMEGLFGRELLPEESATLDELSRAFVASNFDYRALVRAIVTGSVYRRVR